MTQTTNTTYRIAVTARCTRTGHDATRIVTVYGRVTPEAAIAEAMERSEISHWVLTAAEVVH